MMPKSSIRNMSVASYNIGDRVLVRNIVHVVESERLVVGYYNAEVLIEGKRDVLRFRVMLPASERLGAEIFMSAEEVKKNINDSWAWAHGPTFGHLSYEEKTDLYRDPAFHANHPFFDRFTGMMVKRDTDGGDIYGYILTGDNETGMVAESLITGPAS